MTLVLSTVRAAMSEMSDVPFARRRDRTAATVVLCLRAVGARRDTSKAAVEVAMDALAEPQRPAARDRERPSPAY